jgi:3-methyladenine DNA glycosylase/8-oxoguanine DNA glycosylase
MTATLWSDDGASLTKAVAHLVRVDPVMADLIDRVGHCRIAAPRRATPFQYLLRAIVGQQLSGKAAATIFGRVAEIYSPTPPDPARVLATAPERLRAAGLSGAKTRSAHDLARFAVEGRLPSARALRGMPAADVTERLTAIRGVGPWTVEMLLIFYLGHPDVLPLSDLGVRRGFQVVYRKRQLPHPRFLARHGARWSPYRSVASWYLWRALELPPD